jgi:hypothetical protein
MSRFIGDDMRARTKKIIQSGRIRKMGMIRFAEKRTGRPVGGILPASGKRIVKNLRGQLAGVLRGQTKKERRQNYD